MAMVIDNMTFLDLDFPPCYSTSTTSTSTDDENCNWKHWSPVVNWDELSGNNTDFDHDDLINIHEYMMDDNNLAALHHRPDGQRCTSNSLNVMDAEDPYKIDEDEDEDEDDDAKGLRLVHLLMAAAEALNKSRELARVILVRLKELVSPNDGTNMERLAAHFTDALQALLDGSNNNNNKHFLSNGLQQNYKDDHHHQTDVLAAFQLLQDMSPYVKFGHFTANQAILEAVKHERRVHIVDYDIMEGIQWASLMQSLVSRKDGPNVPHLRITALSRSGGGGRRSFGTVQETGRRLAAFAASIGQPFSFHQCRLDSDHETFKPSGLKLVRGEALIVNCMLHLPHFSYRAPDSIASFLSGAKTLNPRLITLVEEETASSSSSSSSSGEFRGFEFVSKFMDSLHHYSAVYDSLEAGFPMQDRARELVERVFLGPQIAGSVSRIYRERRGDVHPSSWGDWLAGMGFHPCAISFANHCQAKLLLGLFNDGYRVEELASNKLVLGWKSRRLLSASVWTSPEL